MAVTPEQAMRRAIDLSRQGLPAPNPRVGCVLVRNEQVIGEGYHAFAGGPHAEVAALQTVSDARGAIAYVTLEPCSHHGRTPPCTDALVAAGVSRVIYATEDPNPKARGGAAVLRSSRIEVEAGLLAEEAREANEAWLIAMTKRHPYVNLKAAITLDGRIALPSGESKWITGEEAREEGHRLRAERGCVLVGAGTVLRDDPQLTARIPGVVNQPLKVVLDPRDRLKGTEPALQGAWWVKGSEALDPKAILNRLWSAEFTPHSDTGLQPTPQTGVLVEGGAWTLSLFLQANLWDRLDLFIAPKVFGAGPSWFSGSWGMDRLGNVASIRRLGEDVHVTLVR
ncbi:MAG TPA: bifunctional diaminohydroxyphosphoribosylaminopyrimidine deaminase/5-amino-6-(5-phosphoribosylamino)uracil reductase RibD [Fimbriimonadaceae bacterium]|nr:bifunctional diaminohydroxyphosphoribosylaminopyrimidine deaminase/5-amino-6-(5-phosphoribosylamino)uracil reductase RibD [Fimbriimonadaceae bacterium]